MKMTNKFLMGAVAALSLVAFAGCGDLLNLKNDDTEGAIKGSNTKYTVEYENTSGTAYRAYKATTMKHAGALVKVTFDTADVSTSKMGVIFDLKEDDENEGAKEFYIIGLNPSPKNGTVKNFYVSKFTNVTDIQANNFGTKNENLNVESLKDNWAVEKEIVPLALANNIEVPAAAEDGSISFYVYYKLLTDGSFDYAVLNMTDAQMKAVVNDTKFDEMDFTQYTVLVKGNTKAVAGEEYEPAESGKESSYYGGVKNDKQNLLAYYAQIAPNTTLTGSWYVPNTVFHEAEDAE